MSASTPSPPPPLEFHAATIASRFEPETFGEVMAEQLRRAPWIAISVLAHAIVGLILWQIPRDLREEKRLEATLLAKNEVAEDIPDEIIEEKREPIVDPKITEVTPVETPVLTPTENNEDESIEDDSDSSAFEDSQFMNDIIGIGPGAGRKGIGLGRCDGVKRAPDKVRDGVTGGLQWLQKHQDPDGKWSSAEFMKHDPPNDLCTGPGSAMHDVGVTGLALLAFLGDGSTLRYGKYRENIKRGIVWLVDQQDPETGLIGVEAGQGYLYNHAIAALALVEAHGLSRYRVLKKKAQRAIDYIERARNPYKVWRYYPRDGDNDTSITGWMVFALKSAKEFGLKVDEQALKYSLSWFDEVTDPSTGQCGYTKRGESSSRELGLEDKFPSSKTESLTAVAALCRIFLGQKPKDHPVLLAAADTMIKKPPVWNTADGSIDFYYWYYGSYAMFQIGGKHWKRWQKAMHPALLKTQRRKGAAKGSWDPVGAWGHQGGRVYSTAIGVLSLEVYYRYSPLLR